jgi:hypothetical protein
VVAVLAIGLGLVSVVSANWDASPGLTWMTVHFAGTGDPDPILGRW